MKNKNSSVGVSLHDSNPKIKELPITITAQPDFQLLGRVWRNQTEVIHVVTETIEEQVCKRVALKLKALKDL